MPGNAAESLLYKAAAHEGELKMPPGSRAPLPEEDLAILRKWINEGAVWPASSVGQRGGNLNGGHSRTCAGLLPRPAKSARQLIQSTSSFRLKLGEKGLNAAPRADKLTLLRRVYFDLIGLPPSPEEAAKFLSNSSPKAYEDLIDNLLASPRYGERWARHWLDVARYADSAGFEGDVYYPNAWRYRDYVIKSFNEDKPYDRFVQEQIAGDELWPDNLDLTGFYDVPYEKLEHLEARSERRCIRLDRRYKSLIWMERSCAMSG